MWGRFESPDLWVSSAAPCSTVRFPVDRLVGPSGALWYQYQLRVNPPSVSSPIKETILAISLLLISFHQQLSSFRQRLLPKPSSLTFLLPDPSLAMPCATSTFCRASASANPCLNSPYPLRSRRRTLANPPTLEQPSFAGHWGQPIVIDNPAPDAPPAELPAFIKIPAPPGLGSPMFRPQTPRPGLDSPVFRPETPRPANLDSPVFSSNKENPFVNQLASAVYQPGSPTHPLPNGDDPFVGNLGHFVVHRAVIGDGWPAAPEFHHPAPPHPDSPDTGAPFGLDPAPEYNLPPIPAPYPAVKTYPHRQRVPFTDFSPVPTPEPRGFFDPAVFHRLNDQQIEDLLERQHKPGRFNRYAFGPHHFTGFYQSISSY
ncbi:hypothetical protein PCASD_10885 [Puccinia coronata f. sp. avenae]|uniref:Uncharacterized protein n=1 Tax=Puccinia coronata f. sp. avenae TaxID=200324 RepID=A0A2N5UU53_9BASI|nr:hypothetical protein PCASD_10885 [Puccinia coronata f. sp. avenae]